MYASPNQTWSPCIKGLAGLRMSKKCKKNATFLPAAPGSGSHSGSKNASQAQKLMSLSPWVAWCGSCEVFSHFSHFSPWFVDERKLICRNLYKPIASLRISLASWFFMCVPLDKVSIVIKKIKETLQHSVLRWSVPPIHRDAALFIIESHKTSAGSPPDIWRRSGLQWRELDSQPLGSVTALRTFRSFFLIERCWCFCFRICAVQSCLGCNCFQCMMC